MDLRPLCALALLLAPLTAQEQVATFGATVRPFLEAHCFKCHGARRPKADLDLSALKGDFASATETTAFARVLDQLQAGLMPPRSRPQPDAAARRAVVHTLADAVLASPHGAAFAAKMQLPQYGNRVDHHSLFSGEFDAPPFTRARIWRHSPYVFDGRRQVNKRVRGVQNPFAFSTPKTGMRDYAATGLVGASVVETSLLNAASELDWMFAAAGRDAGEPQAKGRRGRTDPLTAFVRGGSAPDAAAVAAAIEPTFLRLVDRAPTAEETGKYVGLYEKNLRDTGDPAASLRATLTAIYVCPEALYRMEWGLGPTDEHGRRMLSPEELANALSYALFDASPHGGGRGPKQLIGRALAQGRLKSKEDVRALVTAILGGEEWRSKSARRTYDVPRVMRFFREFFGFDRAGEVFKDGKHVGEHGLRHDPRRLVADAENLIAVILREDQNVFEELLTTNRALVLHDGDNQTPVARLEQARRDLAALDDAWARQQTERRLRGVAKKPKYKNNPKLLEREQAKIRANEENLVARERARLQALIDAGPPMQRIKGRDLRYILAYNLDPRRWEWPAEQPFDLPKEQRAGILTHPSWLVAHSGNDDTDPIHRGIWVYEKLLAGVIADVPPDVDARIPEDPHKTLRERMAPLRAKECWKCHHKINPLGEPFEVFDDFGRFRTQLYFDKDKRLETRTHETVPAETRGGTALRRIDRETLVAAGEWTTRPVDAKSSFDGLDVPDLSGEFDNAVEMIRAIARTDRARQSILRHLFRYFLGRNETLADSRTLREADRAYLDSGGSLRAALVSLLSSDSFLYRR